MNDSQGQDCNSRNQDDDESNGENIGDVCRDFLRNVCRRGQSCRFRHPDPSEAEELGKKIEYIFCHDYQNRECKRQNCRFLHCTKQEEEVYRSNGKMPQHVLEKMAANKKLEMQQANVPICKDNLKGECRRGPLRCKFRHVTQSEYDAELGADPSPFGRFGNSAHGSGGVGFGGGGGGNPFNDHNFEHSFAPPEPKRRAYDMNRDTGSFSSAAAFAFSDRSLGVSGMNNSLGGGDFDYGGGSGGNVALQAAPMAPTSMYNPMYLEEENAALRRRIDELKKQVADLMATNEFLLEQNAQLRALGKGGPGSVGACPPAPLPPPMPQLSSDMLTPARSAAEQLAVGVATVQAAAQAAMAGLPVSIASMAASMPGSVSLSTSSPLVSYPIITTQSMQSMRPAVMSHSLSNIH